MTETPNEVWREMKETLKAQDLIRRAAELLLDEPYNRGDQREWRRKRSEWFKDAGMGESNEHER